MITGSDPRETVRAKYNVTRGGTFDHSTPLTFSLSLEGLEGTGKTHFAINTMPLPLVLVNFGDRSAVPFLYKMAPERAKQIMIYDIQPKSEEGWTFEEAVKSLISLTEIIQAEAPRMPGGSFILDGGSSWWSAMQRVFVEPKEKERLAKGQKSTGGIIYAEANDRVRGILGFIKTKACFLAITHQMSQDWDREGPIPGSFSPRRNSQIAGIVEVVLRFAKFCTVCAAPDCQNPQHAGRVHKARLVKFAGNTSMEGLWIDDPTFAKIYAMYSGQAFKQQEITE